jgi:rhodanese-related sulfurtransferase
MENLSMTPEELKKSWDAGEKILLLDVREPEELQIASIGGTHIPLGDLGRRFHELDPDQEIVVMCHHGVRSAHATAFLRAQGFEKVRNLSGGIERWSVMVDSSIPRY